MIITMKSSVLFTMFLQIVSPFVLSNKREQIFVARESPKLFIFDPKKDSVRRTGKHLHFPDDWYLEAIQIRDAVRSRKHKLSHEELESYLQELIGMEAGCAGGTIPSVSEVCSDPIWLEEIINSIRLKLGYRIPCKGYDPKCSHESEDHVQPNLDDYLHP